jgi:hypothetical protein
VGALVLCLASCEERPVLPGGDGDPGDGDGDGDGDPAIECVPNIQGNLVITDDTPLESITCVEQVAGNLTVGPTTQLIDLQVLSSLRTVGGTAEIVGNFSLISVEGLESLEQAEWLHIRRNRNLSDLHGLGGLTSVDRITVTSNAALTNLAGLPDGLAPTQVEIADNKLLASLDGLPNFTTPGALQVEIDDNPLLIDLGGLWDCCADQTLALSLDGNDKLPDLDGLENFTRLESLRLSDNVSLENLDGLDGLIEVHELDIAFDHCATGNDVNFVDLYGAPNLSKIDVLQIQWAGGLTSIAGLAGVTSLTKLLIRNNEMLPVEAVNAFADQQSDQMSLVKDICGGIGDGVVACSPEPCPMF